MNISLSKKDLTPDFVVGTGKVQIEELKQYANENGIVWFDLLKSSGKYDRSCGYYIKVSDYYFKKKQANNDEEPFK